MLDYKTVVLFLRTGVDLIRAKVKTAVEVKYNKIQLDREIYLISECCLKTASSAQQYLNRFFSTRIRF